MQVGNEFWRKIMAEKGQIPASLGAGIAGAVVLTLIHETARHLMDDAPRMDELGERALVKMIEASGHRPPGEPALHRLALAGDIATNSLFYALVGKGKDAWLRGGLLGALAGMGAAYLPPYLGLGNPPHGSNPKTQLMTIAYYLSGGLAAAAVAQVTRRK
jgi:hypothetical protein